MGDAALKLEDVTSETADPAVVVRLANYKHRRRHVGSRLPSGNSHRQKKPTSEHGLYRYTAFGEAYPADATTPAPAIDQPLQWKARWLSPLAGGIYDVRARQWAPQIGAFLQIDQLEQHDDGTTLWGWARKSPVAFSDLDGHLEEPGQCIPPWTCIANPKNPIDTGGGKRQRRS
jgi:RHS repeat-associated protein